MDKLSKLKSHGSWVGRWTFILAATGSAVGLGNIWGFPFQAGTNGGGAFVIIYLLCILAIGIPIMISEIIIGRRSGNSPINAMKQAAIDSNTTSAWQLVGWSGIVAGIIILSFYSVIAGICLNYIFIAATSSGIIESQEQYNSVISSSATLITWHSIFILLTAAIVSSGIHKGIGRMVKILMPMLGALLIFMVINGILSGGFSQALSFLFEPDFSKVNSKTFLAAMGQAFFSLSLGMGSIMAYGAYMPKEQKIMPTSFTVASLDTLVAIFAGLAIFPIIYAFNLPLGQSEGLVFISLLTAFNDMAFGQIVGPLFFILLSVAALSSSISLLEPGVAFVSEEGFMNRKRAAISISFIAWVLGLGTAITYSNGQWFLIEMNFVANQVLLPLGGMFIAIFVGWFMNKKIINEEIGYVNPILFKIWRFFIKFIAPISVAIIFYNAILG